MASVALGSSPSRTPTAARTSQPAAVDPLFADLGSDAQTAPSSGGTDPLFSDLTPTAPSWTDTAKDVALSAGSGLVRGAAETAMFPVTVKRAAEGFIDRRLSDIEGLFGYHPTQEVEAARQDARDASGLIDRPVYAAQDAARTGLDDALHQPTTTAGRYAGAAAEMVPGAIAGGSSTIGSVVRNGLVPGLAAQAAGDATQGTPYQGAAQTLAAIAAGGAAQFARSPSSAAQRMAGRAAGSVTAQQFDDAAQLVRTAQQAGITLTWPEAVQAVTNGSTGLGNMQRFVESTPTGNDVLGPIMAQRPAQVEAAGRGFMRQIAPDTTTPSYQGTQANEAAQAALLDIERQRTAATSPSYQAAASQTVPAAPMSSILDRLRAEAAADQTGFVAPHLNDLHDRLTAQPATPGTPATRTPVYQRGGVAGPAGPNDNVVRWVTTPATPPTPPMPILDIEQLDRVRKAVRDDLGRPTPGVAPVPKYTAGRMTDYLNEVDNLMTGASPDLVAGRALHAQLSDTLVNPRQAGPLGTIADTTKVPAQVEALMPQNPLVGSQAETTDAIQRMIGTGPAGAAATRGIVRQGVERQFNEATAPRGAVQSDQFGGARFASQMRSNPQRAANIVAAIHSAVSPAAAHAFGNMLDAMGATGWRQRAGSLTSFNNELQAELREGGPAAFFKWVGKPVQQAVDAVNRARLGGQAGQLAQMFTTPQGLDALRALAARHGRRASNPAILGPAFNLPLTTRTAPQAGGGDALLPGGLLSLPSR